MYLCNTTPQKWENLLRMPSGYEKSDDYGGPEPKLLRLYLVAAVVIIAIIAWFVVPAFAETERYYQKRFCTGMKLEVTTQSGSRADCVSDEYAIEVDFSKKWAEAIGQSLHYASELNRKAGIVLVCKNTLKCAAHGYRLESTIKANKLPITVWYCQIERFKSFRLAFVNNRF